MLIENFRPGGLDALGLGYDALSVDNPGLIYCSLKGFLSGPYEHRPALDETVQMMGGLAYMTGPPGRPLRAGASVNDIMGGMFAVIGIMGALMERAQTGRGQRIRSALFENNAFLVSQHMAQFAVTGKAAGADAGAHLVVGHLRRVRHRRPEPDLHRLRHRYAMAVVLRGVRPRRPRRRRDARHQSAARRRARPPAAAAARRCSASSRATRSRASARRAAVGYAPITRPDELFDDPQLKQPGAMVEVTLADGRIMPIPALPLEMNGERFGMRLDIPHAGEHSAAIAAELGCNADEIRALVEEGVLGVSDAPSPTQDKAAESASA